MYGITALRYAGSHIVEAMMGLMDNTPARWNLKPAPTRVSEVVDRLGYDDRTTMDVKAGLLARVSMLCRGGGKGLMLDARRSLPLDTLFNFPCVLELKQLDQAQAAFETVVKNHPDSTAAALARQLLAKQRLPAITPK